MKKSINILSALLLVQVALAVFLLTREEPTATFTAKEPLVAVSNGDIDKLVVESKEGDKLESLELVKKDGVWIVPAYYNFPASDSKVRDFMASMAGFKKSWPVGKTKISAKQFKVVDESFERRLSFFKGDKKLTTLYLGSSPSFKKVHARVDDDDYTYSIAFNTFEAQVKSKDWINKNYLAQERAKVKSIKLAEVELKNESGDFVLAKLDENQETDRSKVSPVASKAIAPSFDEVLGMKDKAEIGEEVFSYELQVDEATVKYTYYKPVVKVQEAKKEVAEEGSDESKPEEKLILLVSNSPFAFEVGKKKIDTLVSVKLEELAKAKDVAKPEENNAEDSGDANKGAGNGTQNERSSYSGDDSSEDEALVLADETEE